MSESVGLGIWGRLRCHPEIICVMDDFLFVSFIVIAHASIGTY